MATTCILLNSDYSPLGVISWKKAVRLVYKGKAEVIKESERIIQNFDKTVKIVVPSILRLVKLIRSIFKARVPYSKRNVLIRDDFKCAYCGVVGKHMTIDHVYPKSLGGKSTFENTVCACLKCNNTKDSRTCQESNMYPKYSKPVAPTIMEFILRAVHNSGLEKVLKDEGIL